MVEAHFYSGAIDAAESAALALSQMMSTEPYYGMWYLTVLAGIRLVQGRAAEAVEIAERAFQQSRALGMGFWCRHAMLLLVRAEAHHAAGNRPAACQAIRDAQEGLLRRAGKIPDPNVRRCFLENIPEHKRTLQLAQQWLGEAAEGAPATAAEHPG